MAQLQRIVHSIPPTFDERSRVLVLGTMPSPASRDLGFNYGHPRNRFWNVMAQLAGEPLPATNERKRDFCLRHHIALWDVLAECDIEGASDASIRNARPNRLTDITLTAPIEAVFCTGAKSYELYNRFCADDVGIPAVKLPSTSPANAACSTERLLREYAAIFEHEHPFEPPTLDVANVVKTEQAIAAAGTSLHELMQRAGTAVAKRVLDILAENEGASHVTILCGNGNNGGDGWVASALLAQAGVPVCLVAAKHPDELTAQPAHDAAVSALDILEQCGLRSFVLGKDPDSTCEHPQNTPAFVLDDGSAGDRSAIDAIMQRSHVVVDAILGTGAAKAPREPFLRWVNAVNQANGKRTVIAVDVPTGTSADTGERAEPCITADETITMIVRKPGLTAPQCGRVSVAPLAYLEPLLA